MASGLLALALSFQRMGRDGVAMLRNCAIVQAFPVFTMVVLSDIKTRELNLEFIANGTNYLFFGSLAFWAMLVGTRNKSLPGPMPEAAPKGVD